VLLVDRTLFTNHTTAVTKQFLLSLRRSQLKFVESLAAQVAPAMADFGSGDRNYLSYTASHNGNKGIYWEALVGLDETSNRGDVLCTLGFRGTTIAALRHKLDRIYHTSLQDLADNVLVVELHCFSQATDGDADDSRLTGSPLGLHFV
jgi:hypothetical protein